MSYSVADEEGKALRNSILIAQIKKIFPELSEESDVVSKNYEITTKEATFDCVIDKYKELIDENEIEQEWKDVIAWYKENEAQRVKRVFEGANFTNVPEKISYENNI